MDEAARGPATNLLRSIVRLGGTLLGVAHTRVELLAAEVAEEVERDFQILLWAMAALFAGTVGMLLASATVVIYFWDTHRMAAALVVTAAFVFMALLAGLTLRRHLRERPHFLSATRDELRRDVVALRSEH